MILSIYHEIVKMASQKKHYIMLIGFAFLMVMMVFVFWKFQDKFQEAAGGMVNGMPFLMKMMVSDPVKLCDGLMFARFSCQILFWVVMPIFAFMFAGEAIACEQQDGTLRAYLSRGFSRTQIVIAKFIAVFAVILFYSMLFAALTMLVGVIFFGYSKVQITLFMGVPGEFPSAGLVTAGKAIGSYYLATLYSAFALSAISSVSFLISVFVKRMTVAATGGLVFFFVSLIMQLAFSDFTEEIRPFLITRVMDGYSQMFTVDAVNWDSIVKSFAVMCIYWSVCVATPVVVLNMKEY
jgi:ABC-type transport system involved in multi-copper enzyme maturation permease subunit